MRSSIETTFRANAKLARVLWGKPSKIALHGLKALSARYSLSVAAGDIQLIDGRWYVTHAGLLRIAHPPHGSKDVADCFAAVIFHCETGFMGGSTSQWANVTTLSVVPRTSPIEDQDVLWEKIARDIPLSPEEIERIQ